MDYKACWNLQQTLFDALTAAKTYRTAAPEGGTPASEEAGTILLVEHPPVYTLGKSGHAENLLVGREALEAMGAQFFHIDRGGDITFHGPGQLVCYPILDLERLGIGLRAYIDALEEAVIRTVARYGIRAGRIAGASGVWVGTGTADAGENGSGDDEKTRTADSGVALTANYGANGSADEGGNRTANDAKARTANEDGSRPTYDNRLADDGGNRTANDCEKSIPRKICAIGVRSSRYITMHGFALNVTTDLEWFSRINPCGFTDRGVTSIERETGRKVPMDDVKELVVKFLSEILNVRIYK